MDVLCNPLYPRFPDKNGIWGNNAYTGVIACSLFLHLGHSPDACVVGGVVVATASARRFLLVAAIVGWECLASPGHYLVFPMDTEEFGNELYHWI